MPQLFAFLRAINAGPGRVVKMNVLRRVFESLGFSGVATFLGSGNVVFEAGAAHLRTFEETIARKLRKILDYDVSVFIRTPGELKKIASFRPFKNSEIKGADLNVILLPDNLDKASRTKLLTLNTETDGFRLHGREVYWWRRKKPGTSLFATVPLAKTLPVPFTIRSLNTIRRLVAKSL